MKTRRLVPPLLLLALAAPAGPIPGPPGARPTSDPGADRRAPPRHTLQSAYDRLYRWGRRARHYTRPRLEASARHVVDELLDARIRADRVPLVLEGVREGPPGWTYCVLAPGWGEDPYLTGVPRDCRTHGLPVDYRLPRWRSFFQLVGSACREVVATAPPRTLPELDRADWDEGCLRGVLVRLRGGGPGPGVGRERSAPPEPRFPSDTARVPRGTPPAAPSDTLLVDLEGRIAGAAVRRLTRGTVKRDPDLPYSLMAVVLEIRVTGWEPAR